MPRTGSHLSGFVCIPPPPPPPGGAPPVSPTAHPQCIGCSVDFFSRAAAPTHHFLQALEKHDFPVPRAVDQNRHAVLMSMVDAYPFTQVRSEPEAEGGLPWNLLSTHSMPCLLCDYWSGSWMMSANYGPPRFSPHHALSSLCPSHTHRIAGLGEGAWEPNDDILHDYGASDPVGTDGTHPLRLQRIQSNGMSSPQGACACLCQAQCFYDSCAL